MRVNPSTLDPTNVEVKSFDRSDINNVLPNDLGEAAVLEFGDESDADAHQARLALVGQ